MYIILAIIIFGILIATHELGHFLVAKACGVKVLEFSIGMGPALLKKRRGETLYALRLLPLGGYCAMEGEDEDSEDPRAFSSQPPWKRILILAAGAAANFAVGFLLVLLAFSQSKGFASAQISDFMDGCPYEGEELLQAGDVFWEIDGHRIYFSSNVSEYASRSGSDYHDIVILRNGEKLRFEDFYMPLREYTNEDGETVTKYGFYFASAPANAGNVLKYSWYCCLDFVRMIWLSLIDLVTGAVGLKELSGPVRIIEVVNEAAAAQATTAKALREVAYFFALIAINLAVMNLLPIPALDGGRIFFLLVSWLIESVSKRKLNPKYEGYIHSAGFVLLMGLMVFVMFNDIARIVTGG